MMKHYLLFALCCSLMTACGGQSGEQAAADSTDDEEVESETTEVAAQGTTIGTSAPEGKELETIKNLETVRQNFNKLQRTEDKRAFAYGIKRFIDQRRQQLKKRLADDDSPSVKAYCERESKKLDEYMDQIKMYLPN